MLNEVLRYFRSRNQNRNGSTLPGYLKQKTLKTVLDLASAVWNEIKTSQKVDKSMSVLSSVPVPLLAVKVGSSLSDSESDDINEALSSSR